MTLRNEELIRSSFGDSSKELIRALERSEERLSIGHGPRLRESVLRLPAISTPSLSIESGAITVSSDSITLSLIHI